MIMTLRTFIDFVVIPFSVAISIIVVGCVKDWDAIIELGIAIIFIHALIIIAFGMASEDSQNNTGR